MESEQTMETAMIFTEKLPLALLVSLLPASLMAQTAESVAPGSYECWGNGSARMLLNFKVTGNGR